MGKNTKKIKEYIRTQLQEDIVSDQIRLMGFPRLLERRKILWTKKT